LAGTPAGLVGFGTTGDLIQIYDALIGSAPFATYNLQSFIGPIGPEASNPAAAVAGFSGTGAATSGGALIVPTLTNISFQVTSSAPVMPTTPAPNTLVLFGIALAVMATWRFGSRIFAR
jgi:hypothetical protein